MTEPIPSSSSLPSTVPAVAPREEVHIAYPDDDSALSLAETTMADSSTAHQEAADTTSVTDNMDEDDADVEIPFDDGDSAFGGSLIGCDTDTLASYITDYRYENGRRYHAYRDGEYWVFYSGLFWEICVADCRRDRTTSIRVICKISPIICTS